MDKCTWTIGQGFQIRIHRGAVSRWGGGHHKTLSGHLQKPDFYLYSQKCPGDRLTKLTRPWEMNQKWISCLSVEWHWGQPFGLSYLRQTTDKKLLGEDTIRRQESDLLKNSSLQPGKLDCLKHKASLWRVSVSLLDADTFWQIPNLQLHFPFLCTKSTRQFAMCFYGWIFHRIL